MGIDDDGQPADGPDGISARFDRGNSDRFPRSVPNGQQISPDGSPHLLPIGQQISSDHGQDRQDKKSHVAHTAEDVRIGKTWSRFYRKRGYNPLPTRHDKKQPLVRYAEFWEKPFPGETFEQFHTGSMQLMTGRRWGLVVIDLDGPEGIEEWPRMGPKPPRTWITHSGGDGRHLWFRVPTEGPPIKSGRLWGIWDESDVSGKGDWRKHVAVELIGERKLIMAPPSIHPNGQRYRFLGGCSPEDIAEPAMLPRWVMELPRLRAPLNAPSTVPFIDVPRKAPVVPITGRWMTADVIDAIGDKTSLAKSWGLRIASYSPNASGWSSCHAIGREDRNPSASFNPTTGRYWEPGGVSVGFFDLAVLLGRYGTWQEAREDLGNTYANHLRRA